MKAWRVYDFNHMLLDEVPVPEPPPGWVLLRVLAVQPSVTEVSLFLGLKTIAYDTVQARISAEAPVQLFGHEFCGRIAGRGAGATDLTVGQRVVARGEGPCRECPLCLNGKPAFCQQRRVLGWTCAGALAEFVIAPRDMLAVIPDEITDSEGASIQPLSDAAAAVEALELRHGESVAILGQGVMGLMSLQVARCMNAGRIFAIDVNPETLRLAAEFGADVLVNVSEQDAVATVLERTHGIGADIVIDAAGGNPQVGLGGNGTINQAIRMARQLGRVAPLALYSESVAIDTWELRDKGLKLIFPPSSSEETLDRCVRWVAAKQVRLKPLITHVLRGLEQVPEAFAITSDKKHYKAIGPAQVIVPP